MKRYLIDTDACVSFLRGVPGMRDRFRKVSYDKCAISQITFAELLFGVHRSAHPEKNREKLALFLVDIAVLPLNELILERFAEEKARLFADGTPVADFDLLIGATAIHHDLILVTKNNRHFQRLRNLKLEDWMD